MYFLRDIPRQIAQFLPGLDYRPGKNYAFYFFGVQGAQRADGGQVGLARSRRPDPDDHGVRAYGLGIYFLVPGAGFYQYPEIGLVKYAFRQRRDYFRAGVFLAEAVCVKTFKGLLQARQGFFNRGRVPFESEVGAFGFRVLFNVNLHLQRPFQLAQVFFVLAKYGQDLFPVFKPEFPGVHKKGGQRTGRLED